MKNSKQKIFTRLSSVIAIASAMLGANLLTTPAAFAADIVVYKNPSCGCCGKWVEHMEQAGHNVKVQNRNNLDKQKLQYGVPSNVQSCHTAVVDGYFIEGHVPASDVEHLLSQRPDIKGLAVPGMPSGSPGMDYPGTKAVPYKVYAITKDGHPDIFSQH